MMEQEEDIEKWPKSRVTTYPQMDQVRAGRTWREAGRVTHTNVIIYKGMEC